MPTNIGIGTYGARLKFLVFDGVRDAGFELILGKTWHITISLRHSIHHVRNIMTIWDKRSCHVLKGSAPPGCRLDEDRVDETTETNEGYVSGYQKVAEVGVLEEQETPVTTDTTVRPQEAANPPQSTDRFVTADEEVGDTLPDTPLEPPQEQTTGGSLYALSDQWYEDGLNLFAVDTSELLVHCPNRTTSSFEKRMRRKFPELFKEPTGIPPACYNDIRLRLVPGSAPPATRLYRLSPPKCQELRKQLKKLYWNSWISDAVSPYAAPVLFVKKADGSLRLCVDYRRLNDITVKDRYPLLIMEDLLHRLHGARKFAKLDLKTGYQQQRLAPKDREKTVFVTEEDLHKCNVLPVGLANAPTMFMRTMNNLLEAHKAYVLVYLDDILIFTKGSDSEHKEAVEAVLRTLHVDGWHLATEMCEWFVDEVHFLGHVGNAEGVYAASSMIDAVAQ